MGLPNAPHRASAPLWWVILVAAGFLVAGCGGSDSGGTERGTGTPTEATTGETPAPSKQEYIAQGDAICADVQVDAARLAQRAQELQTQNDDLPRAEFLARGAELWEDQVRVIESFLKRFEALGSPPGDEARVDEFLMSIEDGLATAREIRDTLSRGEEVPGALVEEYGRANARGDTLADAYGFQVCGQSQ